MIYFLLAGIASAAITQKVGFYTDSGCNSVLSSDDAMCVGMTCAAYGAGLPGGATCSKSGCSLEITYAESFSKVDCETVKAGLDPCSGINSMFHLGYEIDCGSGSGGNTGNNSGGGGDDKNDDGNNNKDNSAAGLSLIFAFFAPLFAMM